MKPETIVLLKVKICGKKNSLISAIQVVRGSQISDEESRVCVHIPG